MAKAAWETRQRAHVFGGTRVGCAIMSADGAIYSACNVEHKFRSHDVHAEVNAITSMVATSGAQYVRLVVIVAERDYFTPCGACMDWIMQFGDPDTIVAFQNKPDGEFHQFAAVELMPHYPK
ncbi:MAG TPA: hypothetical protein VGZ02_17555 [Candidatus Baltobacteraceae bacterium]|nr:hypothetical protein [Candidatus Baltobacteraceae bacterium]